MYQPTLKSATILAEHHHEGDHLVLLGNIEPIGPIRYAYLLVAFSPGSDEPVAIVSSEVNEFASRPDDGSHFLCLFAADGHYNFGPDDAWADLDTFLAAALSVLKDALEPASHMDKG